jgi:hypothetical protein
MEIESDQGIEFILYCAGHQVGTVARRYPKHYIWQCFNRLCYL